VCSLVILCQGAAAAAFWQSCSRSDLELFYNLDLLTSQFLATTIPFVVESQGAPSLTHTSTRDVPPACGGQWRVVRSVGSLQSVRLCVAWQFSKSVGRVRADTQQKGASCHVYSGCQHSAVWRGCLGRDGAGSVTIRWTRLVRWVSSVAERRTSTCWRGGREGGVKAVCRMLRACELVLTSGARSSGSVCELVSYDSRTTTPLAQMN